MNRIKTIKNSNYTTIDNFVSKDIKLSLKAKGLLLVIMSLPNDWDFSINGISKICKEGRDSIYSAINELIKNGYCQRVIIKNDKGQIMGSDYTFFESPYTEKPYTEKPDMGNPTQLNTNIINTLNNNTPDYDFLSFWKDYDKKIDKNKVEKKYAQITLEDRLKIKAQLPKYKLSQPDRRYRKDPYSYLHNQAWENDVIIETKKIKQTIQQVQEVPSHLKKVLNFE
jgi:hypothetical protein